MGEDLLAGMRSDGGLSLSPDGTLTITAVLPRAETPQPVPLGGQYVVRARDVHIEVELIETASARRSLVYLRDGELYLFIAPGLYHIHYRFLMRPGTYRQARLGLTRLSLKARLAFYLAKVLAILQRPPSQWLAVLRRPRASSGIVGATLETVPAVVVPAEFATDGWPAGWATAATATDVQPYADIAALLAVVPADVDKVLADVDVRQDDGTIRPSLQAAASEAPDEQRDDGVVLMRNANRNGLQCPAWHLPLSVGLRTGPLVAPTRPSQAFPLDKDDAVSIVIPTKVHADLLQACIQSLALSPVSKEIIIVDNGATRPDMIACLRDLSMRPGIRVLRHDAPFNFSELCNIGAQAARYPTLLFLNDDVEAVDAYWLTAMLAYAGRGDVGVVGARLLYPSGDLQHAGIATHLVPGPGHPWRGLPQNQWRGHPVIDRPGEVDAVTGACLMIRRDLFQQVGGFDEEAFAITLNDVDLCLKVRARGLKIMYVPQATLLHKEGQSRAADDSPTQAARRGRELKAFYQRYDVYAHESVFCSVNVRRDTDSGAFIG